MILLSVCVPTYCRAAFLRETLGSLTRAMQGHGNWVELVVVDNDSPDETAAVVQEARRDWPDIRYYRNDANVGAEANFRRAVEVARGRYVWVFGDDDLVREDVFDVILAKIRLGADLIVSNVCIESQNLGFVHKAQFFSTRIPSELRERDGVLGCFGAGLGFISAVVFRKVLWSGISSQEYDRFAEVGLSFLWATYVSLPPSLYVVFLQRAYVRQRGNNAILKDWEGTFVDGLARLFDELVRRGYSRKAVVRAKTLALRNYHWHYALNARIASPPARALRVRLRRGFGESPYFWYGIQPIFVLPPSILWALRHAWRSLRSRR